MGQPSRSSTIPCICDTRTFCVIIMMGAHYREINRFVEFVSCCEPNDARLFSKGCSGFRHDSNTREILLKPHRLSPRLATDYNRDTTKIKTFIGSAQSLQYMQGNARQLSQCHTHATHSGSHLQYQCNS